MAKILVFHYTEKGRLPALSKDAAADVKRKIGEVLRQYPAVKFNGTFVDEQGRGICDWEAPSAEVVQEVIAKALGGPAADGAVVVRRVL